MSVTNYKFQGWYKPLVPTWYGIDLIWTRSNNSLKWCKLTQIGRNLNVWNIMLCTQEELEIHYGDPVCV